MESSENTLVITVENVNYVLQAQLYIIPLNYEPNEDHAAYTDTLKSVCSVANIQCQINY